jgi:hypothetical protein
MNLDFKNWSERQQILAVILMTGALIFAVVYFALYPGNRQRKKLEGDIARQRRELAQRGYHQDEAALRARLNEERAQRDAWLAEWRQTAQRLGAFPDQESLAKDSVARIDFKVELHNAREELRRASRKLNIRLPYDLGMEDTVRSNEDARVLMLQLRTVRKMADLLLKLKVERLGRIEPLPPVTHTLADTAIEYLEEYPVRTEFYGSLENVYALFHAMLDREHVFFLKNLRVEAADFDTPGLLRVNATLGQLLFTMDPAKMPAPKAAAGARPVAAPRRF